MLAKPHTGKAVRNAEGEVTGPTEASSQRRIRDVALPTTSANVAYPPHDGWSNLSLVYDTGSVKSTGSGTPQPVKETTGLSGYNACGGARWFFNRAHGRGFDLRLHRLGSAGLFSLSAGIAVR
jgi:hypothetical protein